MDHDMVAHPADQNPQASNMSGATPSTAPQPVAFKSEGGDLNTNPTRDAYKGEVGPHDWGSRAENCVDGRVKEDRRAFLDKTAEKLGFNPDLNDKIIKTAAADGGINNGIPPDRQQNGAYLYKNNLLALGVIWDKNRSFEENSKIAADVVKAASKGDMAEVGRLVDQHGFRNGLSNLELTQLFAFDPHAAGLHDMGGIKGDDNSFILGHFLSLNHTPADGSAPETRAFYNNRHEGLQTMDQAKVEAAVNAAFSTYGLDKMQQR